MKQQRRIIHPNFITGLVSYIALLGGVLLNAYGLEAGKSVIVGSILLGGLHWLGSVVDVTRDPMKKENEGLWYFWFVSVLIIPPLGGMIYYMINNKRVRV
jgi:hypothetical protein